MDSEMMQLFRVDDFIWQRITPDNVVLSDKVLIVGHTITAFYQSIQPYSIYFDQDTMASSKMIAIDCGCACNNQNTQLACLRLDDLQVFYI